jgi:hypothetical protein
MHNNSPYAKLELDRCNFNGISDLSFILIRPLPSELESILNCSLRVLQGVEFQDECFPVQETMACLLTENVPRNIALFGCP